MAALGPRLLFLPACLAIGLIVSGIISSPTAFAGERQVSVLRTPYDPEGRVRVLSWRHMLASSRSGTDLEKLEGVNRFFNELGFMSDAKLWGRSDYWATPVEFVNSGAGDCEDFAVAKYVSLHRLGVPVDRLRLVYVLAVGRKEAHMVLAYFETPQADPLILDNLVPTIRPASHRKDLLPVYSFNDSGLWLVRHDGKSERVGNSGRLKAWKDVQRRTLWASAETE